MKILAVDDERLALDNILAVLKEIVPDAETAGFTDTANALHYLSQNEIDIAFLDIKMAGMSGIHLAKKCKDLCPDINIIFVTGYDQYTLEAFKLHASGYLIKPVRAKDLRTELKNLRHPVSLCEPKRVRIQTFGNFEIFLDDAPLYIPMQKSRECLAYLVDRKGAFVTVAELSAILWEDRPYDRKVQNNAYRVISDLMKYLKELEIDDIILKHRKCMAINMDNVDCDYYSFLRGDMIKINAFHGEYMANYSWAEFTLGNLKEVKLI